LFIVLMTAAHISPNVFSLRKFLSNIQRLFPIVHSNIIHTYYISHSYAHLHLLFYTSYSKLHFFRSSWQAGCPLLLVSDTIVIHVPLFSPFCYFPLGDFRRFAVFSFNYLLFSFCTLQLFAVLLFDIWLSNVWLVDFQ
jgi:hypothetical protein